MTATFEIEVVGLDRRLGSLHEFHNGLPKWIHGTTYEWAQGTRRALKSTPYPPPPPNSTYRRTGRLASGWKVEPKTRQSIRLTNSTPYTPYVVGDASGKGQAWMHVGRWWIARDIIYDRVPKLRSAVGRMIGNQIRRLNL